MATDKYKSQERYDAEHTFRMSIKLNRKTERNIIEWLNRQPRKQTAIKNLIRAAIAAEQNNDE